jgi:hypothetical protein
MKPFALLLGALPLVAFFACGPWVGEGGGWSCMADADCATGWLCGFEEEDGCSAMGTCFLPPQTRCQLYLAGCACDGSTINLACNGLPTGYAPKPFAHMGACTDAEADGGSCEPDAAEPDRSEARPAGGECQP